MIRSILLLLCCTGAVALGDSPITSTDFFQAYQDVEIVQQARSQRLLDAGMASFLSDSTQRIDVKAALINALSWEAVGQNNTVFYTRFLKERYQVSTEDQLLERLSPHELMCLGYITVMEDYFTPQRALPYLERAHAALNEIYQEVLEQLSPAMQEKLKVAQRAWLAFRDANCVCQAFEVQGEEIYPAIYYGCLAQMTRRRSQEIWELLAP